MVRSKPVARWEGGKVAQKRKDRRLGKLSITETKEGKKFTEGSIWLLGHSKSAYNKEGKK